MTREATGKILVAIRDGVLVESLVDVLTAESADVQVTCASSGRDALDIDCVESHHVVLIGSDLRDLTALQLAEHILELRRRPVVLIVQSASSEALLDALRLGVADVLAVPVDVDDLLEAVHKGLRADADERRGQRREHRTRRLIRQVLQERRQLIQRVDLISRDMVAAHRRLFQRVLQIQEQRDTPLSRP